MLDFARDLHTVVVNKHRGVIEFVLPTSAVWGSLGICEVGPRKW
jgi:hypothetical protein